MKILLLNLLMSVTTGVTDATEAEDYSWVLDELNKEIAAAVVVNETEEMVKIFDANGNLVEEITKMNFLENNLENGERKVMLKSAHMFDYLGDSYFLLED